MRPTVHFASAHESGNIYEILARVSRVLYKAGRINEYNSIRDGVYACRDYNGALAVIRESVELIDDDKQY